MLHKNPTLSAQAQVLDPAHPSPRVGSGISPVLAEKNDHDETRENAFSDWMEAVDLRKKLTEDFSLEERLQLSETARLSLEDEIALMRKMIKIFARASKGVQDGKPFPVDLARVIDVLGLSCSRIATLMRVQLLLQGPQSDGLIEDLLESLGTFVDQITSEGEKND